jgi:DNA-binding transcriptional MocR family regulator
MVAGWREKEGRRGGRLPAATSQALDLPLDRGPGAPPLYRQIRDAVRAAVVAGVLGPGMRLPPERELALALEVDRSTITRAYQELAADGVVEGHPSRGTIVCAPAPADGDRYDLSRGSGGAGASLDSAWLLGLPAMGNGSLGPEPGLLRDLAALGARSDLISFAAGHPGHDLVPLAQLQEALLEGLALTGAAGLGYGPVEGLQELRVAIAARLAARGVTASPDQILVTAGAMQGLSLAARALIEPGDEVVVEAPTFVGTLQTFGAAGARLIPVPVDEEGLRVDVLERVLARRRVRLVLVQPTQHNPTGATLVPARRERLIALARRHGVPILEDDAYGELWHEEPDPRPLKALDRSGLVLYLGTFSKTVAPGLRVGWIAAPAPVIARLALAKQFADLNTGALPQLALARFLAEGHYERHLAHVRAAYAERRAAMLAGLRPAARHLQVSPSSRGGLYLWCRLAAGPRARLLAATAGRAGVAVLAGEAFYPRDAAGEDGTDRLRISFASHPPQVIAAGLARLVPLIERLPRMAGADEHAEGLHPVV